MDNQNLVRTKIVVHFKNHNFQDTASVSVTLFLNYNKIIIKLEYASTIALSEPVFERGWRRERGGIVCVTVQLTSN